MSESSTQHADASWPHPESEAARHDGRYTPERHAVCVRGTDVTGSVRDQCRTGRRSALRVPRPRAHRASHQNAVPARPGDDRPVRPA
ncbi:hypothetical protein [Pseudonocardia parietis]|uniref:Uncharacterized protein n=1 Tax=Pseudonocardia parietis TaxID=570936 RepID=A0ABS4W389_9PSEU|nr:hypothetical protein [Pseudonocardia parietis]MBP2370630.1 hypothetical protein [Pseudonocardia parietis]